MSETSQTTTVMRLENLEGSLVTLLQEVRIVKGDIQKNTNGNPTLESRLDAEEVAKILGVDIRYLYRLARDGKIPAAKIGKYWKFSPSKLKKWLDHKNTS